VWVTAMWRSDRGAASPSGEAGLRIFSVGAKQDLYLIGLALDSPSHIIARHDSTWRPVTHVCARAHQQKENLS